MHNPECLHCTAERPIRPTIDHTILSPSGHVSARARKAALAREDERFATFDAWLFREHVKSQAEINAERALSLRRSAANLRDLAARGMKPRAYAKQAAQWEAEAEALEALA